MTKKLGKTLVIECEKCSNILRFEEDELEVDELPTFCHLIPENDLQVRRVTCNGKRFKHVTDEEEAA